MSLLSKCTKKLTFATEKYANFWTPFFNTCKEKVHVDDLKCNIKDCSAHVVT